MMFFFFLFIIYLFFPIFKIFYAGTKTFCTAGILFPGFYPIAKAPVHESL